MAAKKPEGWKAFDELTKKLIQVPKQEVAKQEAARKKRPRKK